MWFNQHTDPSMLDVLVMVVAAGQWMAGMHIHQSMLDVLVMVVAGQWMVCMYGMVWQ
jgi:hypothetical protein